MSNGSGGAFASGALSGAGMGATWGLPGMAIGALAGGLFGYLGNRNAYRQGPAPTQINPWSERAWGMMNDQYNNSTNMMRQQMQQAGAYNAQSSQLLNQMSAQGPMQNVSYDPTAAQREFFAAQPQLARLVDQSITPVGTAAQREQELNMIRSAVGDTFQGSPNSGAFLGTMSQSLAAPIMQRNAQQEQLRAGLMGQFGNQMLSGLQQGMLSAPQIRMQQQQMEQARMMGLFQGYQGLAQGQMQGAGMYGNLAGSALGGIGQMGSPTMWSPDMIANPNYMSPGQMMQIGMSGLNLASENGGLARAGEQWRGLWNR